MNKNSEYSEDVIVDLLNNAIKKLQEKDSKLLDKKFNINERTVTHRLAMYIAEEFPNFDVDCEYNRMALGKKEYIKKSINNLKQVEKRIKIDDVRAITVFPDIIVHNREYKEENLIVIEVKMEWKQNNLDFDYAKLNCYKNELGYKFAVHLILDSEKSILKFFNNE